MVTGHGDPGRGGRWPGRGGAADALQGSRIRTCLEAHGSTDEPARGVSMRNGPAAAPGSGLRRRDGRPLTGGAAGGRETRSVPDVYVHVKDAEGTS